MFPGAAQVERFVEVMRRLGHDPAGGSGGDASPGAIGDLVAATVLEHRHADGSNQLGDPPYADTTGYEPVNTPDELREPDRWAPLRVTQANGVTSVQRFLAPHWGWVTPFAGVPHAVLDRVPPPASVDHPHYAQQARRVLHYSAELDDRRKVIAEYWADGPDSETPPGHWALLAQSVSVDGRHSLGQDVVLFFAVANALLDASIGCWYLKRIHDYVRPVTAIRYLFQDQLVRAWAGPYEGTQLIPGAAWQPYQESTFVTPSFPEYTSGHSTFSAAAAQVLREVTGSDGFGTSHVYRAGSSPVEPGAVPATAVTLHWPTFSDAAVEAGMSRRYGGIHFTQGDLLGRATGRLVGARVWHRVRRLLEGIPG